MKFQKNICLFLTNRVEGIPDGVQKEIRRSLFDKETDTQKNEIINI